MAFAPLLETLLCSKIQVTEITMLQTNFLLVCEPRREAFTYKLHKLCLIQGRLRGMLLHCSISGVNLGIFKMKKICLMWWIEVTTNLIKKTGSLWTWNCTNKSLGLKMQFFTWHWIMHCPSRAGAQYKFTSVCHQNHRDVTQSERCAQFMSYKGQDDVGNFWQSEHSSWKTIPSAFLKDFKNNL